MQPPNSLLVDHICEVILIFPQNYSAVRTTAEGKRLNHQLSATVQSIPVPKTKKAPRAETDDTAYVGPSFTATRKTPFLPATKPAKGIAI